MKYGFRHYFINITLKFHKDEYELLYKNFNTSINKKGHLTFFINKKDMPKNVHTLINLYYNKEEYEKKYKELIETGVEKYLITHHKDFNKLNNHPNNLQWMGNKEHINYHKLSGDLIGYKNLKNFIDKVYNPKNIEYNNFEEYREKEKKKASLLGKRTIKKTLEFYWYGEGSEERRENKIKHFNNLWNGENSEEFRKNNSERLSKRNSTPEHKRKSLEGKIFNIFKKIRNSGEIISKETFLKYKFKGAPYPETVFGSLEIAIEKYKINIYK
jgi:hypothetical protein